MIYHIIQTKVTHSSSFHSFLEVSFQKRFKENRMKFSTNLANILSNFMLRTQFSKFHDKCFVWSRESLLFEWKYIRGTKTPCPWSCWQNTRRRIFERDLISSKKLCLQKQEHFLLVLKSQLNFTLNNRNAFFLKEEKEKLQEKYYPRS